MSAMPTTLNPDQYIETRLKQYQGWYDRKAVSCKKRYLNMRAFMVIAGVIVPVLVSSETSINTVIGYPVMKTIIAVVSLGVGIAASLEGVFHYREQWKNYRSTEQLLGHEQVDYLTKVGAYKGLADEEAFRLLVERVESAISSENAATLNVMATGSKIGADDAK